MPTKPIQSAKVAELRRRAEAELRELRARKAHLPMMAELHRRAAAGLRTRRKNRKPKPGHRNSSADTQRLLHELQVHQVELKLQNEELQKARDEMEEGLEKYSDLYDFSPVGYFTLTAAGAIQLVNLTGASLVGIDRSCLTGQSFGLLVSPDLRPRFNSFLKQVFAGHAKQTGDFELSRKGQPPRAVNIEAQRLLTGLECRAVVVDITVRKQAEEILRRNEALFSALIAQAPVGVYVVDARLRLQQVNPTALPVFNEVQPLIGRDFSEILQVIWPRQVAAQVMERFRHTLITGESYQSSSFAERRRDIGVKEFYEWQIQRVTLPVGEYGVVCFFNNITERKQAEEAQRRLEILAASNRKLEQEIVRRQAGEKALKKSELHQRRLLKQSQLMQERLRRLSHQILHVQEEERKRISRELHDEIAQTLVGINLQLAALTKGAAGQASHLHQKIVRTQRLVEQSVDLVHRFARELRPTALDDLGLIPTLHAFMKEFTKRTGVHARLTAFAAVEQLNITKRTVLYRVAHEALNNVARHAKASRVEVSIQRLPDCVRMEVKDDGKSFNVQNALHANGSKRLGLLGMRERLEMVGGSLRVESAVREGTTVHAQIPLAKPRTPGTTPPQKPAKTKS